MDGMGWDRSRFALRWVTMITNCISFPFVNLGVGVVDGGYAGTSLVSGWPFSSKRHNFEGCAFL